MSIQKIQTLRWGKVRGRCTSVAALIAVVMVSRTPADDGLTQFEKEIRPVLVTHCIKCHGQAKQEAGLRLDSRAGMLKGGDSGPALDVESPANSLILSALRYESLEMPPTGQLDQHIVRRFQHWLAGGAVWPEDAQQLRTHGADITEQDRSWWAFCSVEDFSPPRLSEDTWSQNPIDAFVLARLRDRDLHPAPQADRAVLARRLYFDLIGLPPSPQELDRFLSDDAPDALEKLVDRLLDDPRYGEHWARYWLDLVRYAESDGWNQDAYRPHIWRYRDYVVRSFNADKPYPDFVREQLAGDEIDQDDPDDLVATGFLRLGIYEYNQRDARGHWNDIVNELTDVVGDVFLGLSMACARCHDHKFDPIPQQDYFKLRSFFEPLSWRDDLVAATSEERRSYAEALRGWEAATAPIRAKIDALLEPYYEKKWDFTVDKFPLDIQACFHMPVRERTSWQHQMAYLVSRQFLEEGGGPLKNMSKPHKQEHEALKQQLAEFDHLKPQPLPTVMAASDFEGICAPTFIQDDVLRRPIAPGYLEVLGSEVHPEYEPLLLEQPATKQTHSSGRRSALAAWIADPQNPLTMRVIVNRIWQQHFGRGLVSTPSDLGSQGALPTHPELLDWLTMRFIEGGGKLKSLHKRIVMSATWQQSAENPHASDFALADPDEQLLWRAPVRRLRAEQIRDALLVASGELDPTIGGPSVDEKTHRRALYVKSFRNRNDSFLHGFDMANGLKSVPIRDNTTTPTQALLLINGDYALGRAASMARRILATAADSSDAVRMAFRFAWNREPLPNESEQAEAFLGAPDHIDGAAVEQRFADFCHVLFNSSKFLYCE